MSAPQIEFFGVATLSKAQKFMKTISACVVTQLEMAVALLHGHVLWHMITSKLGNQFAHDIADITYHYVSACAVNPYAVNVRNVFALSPSTLSRAHTPCTDPGQPLIHPCPEPSYRLRAHHTIVLSLKLRKARFLQHCAQYQVLEDVPIGFVAA